VENSLPLPACRFLVRERRKTPRQSPANIVSMPIASPRTDNLLKIRCNFLKARRPYCCALAIQVRSALKSALSVSSVRVKGFGRRPAEDEPLAPGPSSESLQGRNPREVEMGGAALWGFGADGARVSEAPRRGTHVILRAGLADGL
jgi:hypothetical protein